MSKILDRFGNPLSDSYCSPRWLTALLPQVGTDPCSNPRSTVNARRAYSLETRQDGLKLRWLQSAFVNWPYSNPAPWVAKLREELRMPDESACQFAIVLCKLDPSVGWWHDLVLGVEYDRLDLEMWTLDRRVDFDEPLGLLKARQAKMAAAGKKGDGSSTTNFPSAIVYLRRVSAYVAGETPLLNLGSVATRWRLG